MSFWQLYGEATKTAFGFFWKSGWAFILGYLVSAMIQAFVPKGRLTPYMGKALIYPKRWFKDAREMVEDQADDEEPDFDWRSRIRSRAGWNLVGRRFVSDWKNDVGRNTHWLYHRRIRGCAGSARCC